MPEEDQGQAELTELTLYHDVRVVETVTELPGEKPITITGDQVAIQGVTRPDSRITLLGAPARFEARGVRVDGTNINVDRGDSRIWITGPGTLDVVVQRDLQGRPLAAPGVLRTTWQEGMLLHGSLIRFDEEVTASMSGGRLDTKTLELTLTSPIDLSPGATGGIGAGGGTGGGPEIERLFCRGGVMLENAAHQAGRPTSYDRLRAADLTMNVKTGRMTAAGPGRLSSVRVGSGSMMLAGQGGSSDGAVSSQAADNMTLQALTVEFEGPIGGNMNQRQLTFQRRVRTAFPPVDAWDVVLPTDAPELHGPRGALISCDMLTVAQVYTPLTGEESLELEAVGNTVVEGDLFTARVARMTYAQAKDLLMLEGSGRTDAVLYRRTAIGAAPSQAAARRIYFWPQSRRWKIDDARTLEITGGSLQRR